MDDESLLTVLAEAAGAVRSAMAGLADWRPAGDRPGQYRLDLVADAAALAVLHGAGLRVLSEESGLTSPDPVPPDPVPPDPVPPDPVPPDPVPPDPVPPDPALPGAAARTSSGDGDAGLLVVLDPVDGSTNASLGIPWYATSLCVLDGAGARVALVVNQASGVRYEAVRGGGALRDGRPISPSGCRDLAEAVVGISGFPRHHPGWAQFRALGSAALDHCAVADGALDGYLVVGGSALHAWDYLGGMLVCTEAGAHVAELAGDPLVTRDASRRRPAAAATSSLLTQLLRMGA